jgi:hypothetical protein
MNFYSLAVSITSHSAEDKPSAIESWEIVLSPSIIGRNENGVEYNNTEECPCL